MNDFNKYDIYKELQKELEERKKKQKFFYFDDFLTIEADPNQWLYVDWTGYQTEKSVKDGCEKMLEALLHYKFTKVLNDNTKVLGIWTPASEWVGSNWLPRMKEAGLKHFAWVYSPSIMSQVSTNEAIKKTPMPELVKTFFSQNEAREWLKNQ